MLSSSPGKDEEDATLLRAPDSVLDATSRECPGGRVRSESESLAEISGVGPSDPESRPHESTGAKRRIHSAGPRLEMVKKVVECDSSDASPDPLATPPVTPLVSPMYSEGSGSSASDVKAPRRLVIVRSEAKPLEGLSLKSSLSPNLRFQCLNSLLQHSPAAEGHDSRGEAVDAPPTPLSLPSPLSGERILVLDPVVGPPAKEKIFQLVDESLQRQPRIVSVRREEYMKKEHASIFVLKDPAAKQHRAVTLSRSHTWSLHDEDVTSKDGMGLRRRLPTARKASMAENPSAAQLKGAFSDDEVIISAKEEASACCPSESICGEGSVSQLDSDPGAKEEGPKGRSKSTERQERDAPRRCVLRSNSVRVGPRQKTESPRNVSWLDVEPVSELRMFSRDGFKDREKKERMKDDEQMDSTSQAPPPPNDGAMPPEEGESPRIQRCLIVHRDEKGFGFTVCGDNPVYVESVKPHGPAHKAGIQQYDRIVKVNGSLVLNCNHTDVVKLIKSGSYVALTLLGRPPSQAPPKALDALEQGVSTPSVSSSASPQAPSLAAVEKDRISGPHAVDHDKDLQFKAQRAMTIQMMHKQVMEEYEKLNVEYQKSPSETLQYKLQVKLQMLRRVEDQLRAINASSSASTSSQSPLVSSSAESSMTSPLNLKRPATLSGPTATEKPDSTETVERHTPSSLYRGPAPWLPSGPKHRKADSMPDTLYKIDEDYKDGSYATRTRNSEERENEGDHSTDDVDMKTLPNVPSVDSSRIQSVSTGFPDLMTATETSCVQDAAAQASPMPASLQPLRSELVKSRLKVISPNQVKVVVMDDQDFSTSVVSCTRPLAAGAVVSGSSSSGAGPTSEAVAAVQLATSAAVAAAAAGLMPMTHQVNVISMEDDEFSSDDGGAGGGGGEHVDDPGVFSDLMQLKHRPAHLAVFLHYLISNSDPAAMLFYLVTDTYAGGNIKEMRKWAYEIFSTFLCDRAPLKINVDEATVRMVSATLQTKSDREDMMKNIFQSSRIFAQNEINDHLTDFRSKRALGLGSLYGDRDLKDNMDRQTEMRIVDTALWKHFERLAQDEDRDRSQAMASALSTFFKQIGFTSQKNNSLLDRCSSFNAKDKKVFKFKSNNKKVIHTNGHQFIAQHYFVTTFCLYCQNVLWGIGNQGYQCTNCDINLHKNCVEVYRESCSSGSSSLRKKKERRPPSMFDIISRKLSNTNPAAIKEAQHQHFSAESNLISPVSVLTVRPGLPEGDETGVKSPPDDNNSSSSAGHFQSSVTRAISMPSVRDVAVTSSPKSSSSTYTFLTKLAQKEQDAMPRSVSSNIGSVTDWDKSPDDMKSMPLTLRDQSPDNYEEEYNPNVLSVGLGRSESLNQRSGIRASVRRTHSDVSADNQIQPPQPANSNSGSSSNSSLSARASDSSEGLNDISGTPQTSVVAQKSQFNDSDFDVETELPLLESIIPKELFRKLKPKEKKRQEVINELFYTERTHVRNLKVLHRIFYLPMADDPLALILFPNLEEITEIHCALNNELKARRQESPVVGDFAEILVRRFSGEEGEKFKMAAARFCEQQSHALEVLRQRQRKDQKMATLLQDASSNSLCRRLELKDLILTELQRLTKYPLLIESLLKYTVSNTDEYDQLLKAHDFSKDLLNHVNQRVEDCENQQKLTELQKRLDRRPIENSTHPVVSEYKKLDLTRHKMIYDGVLTWRINRSKHIDHHVILFDDILVLLQKQDDRLVLRCQSGNREPGKDDSKLTHTHSPIIKLNNVLTRNVAVDKRAFFLVSISETIGPQIYELAASTKDERNKWFKYITDAAEAYKVKGKRTATSSIGGESSSAHLSDNQDASIDDQETTSRNKDQLPANKAAIGSADSDDHQPEDGVDIDPDDKRERADSMESLGRVEVLNFEPPQLVQPNEVKVSRMEVMEKLEPVKTPLDFLREKNRLIEKTMAEKKQLVARLLNVPVDDYDHMAEIAGEVFESQDVKELLFGSLAKADELTILINEGLDESLRSRMDSAGESQHFSTVSRVPVTDEDVKDSVTTTLSSGFATCSELTSKMAQSQSDRQRVSTGPTIVLSGSQLLSITGQLQRHLVQIVDVILKQDLEKEGSRRPAALGTVGGGGDQSRSLRLASQGVLSSQPDEATGRLVTCSSAVEPTEQLLTTSSDQPRCVKLSSSIVTFPVVMEHVEVIEVETIVPALAAPLLPLSASIEGEHLDSNPATASISVVPADESETTLESCET